MSIEDTEKPIACEVEILHTAVLYAISRREWLINTRRLFRTDRPRPALELFNQEFTKSGRLIRRIDLGDHGGGSVTRG